MRKRVTCPHPVIHFLRWCVSRFSCACRLCMDPASRWAAMCWLWRAQVSLSRPAVRKPRLAATSVASPTQSRRVLLRRPLPATRGADATSGGSVPQSERELVGDPRSEGQYLGLDQFKGRRSSGSAACVLFESSEFTPSVKDAGGHHRRVTVKLLPPALKGEVHVMTRWPSAVMLVLFQ